jgi:Cu/Ag efflux protein CusF
MLRLGLLLTLALVAPALPAGAHGPASGMARIHGTITKIDPARHTFWIHHDPFAQMPMSMTMEVEPVRVADLSRLHRGEIVSVTIDTSIVPWPGTNIRSGRH